MVTNQYIENIVIGRPLVHEHTLLALNPVDWIENERAKTYYTAERFLPRILVDLGIYPSVSEVKRNKPELMKELTKIDFINKLKVGKKRFLWIVVGE